MHDVDKLNLLVALVCHAPLQSLNCLCLAQVQAKLAKMIASGEPLSPEADAVHKGGMMVYKKRFTSFVVLYIIGFIIVRTRLAP
jgi:hypothetical protein